MLMATRMPEAELREIQAIRKQNTEHLLRLDFAPRTNAPVTRRTGIVRAWETFKFKLTKEVVLP